MGEVFSGTNDACRTFCIENRITEETWSHANIDWQSLVEIGHDHLCQMPHLETVAAFYGGWVQRMTGIHSVRWRVKDAKNLMAKIVRKRASARPGYEDISVENYYNIITDLLGVRALHLFKDDIQIIHPQLVGPDFPMDHQEPIANVRQGDDNDLADSLGIKVEIHAQGYRSIHYVKEVKPGRRALYFELQVRTIFEEGWSEVDHRVRYPNYSQEPLIAYNSSVLNRLAGGADEMALAIKKLAHYVVTTDRAREQEGIRTNEIMAQLEALAAQTTGDKKVIGKLNEKVNDLREQLATAKPVFGSSWRQYFADDGKDGHISALSALTNLDSANNQHSITAADGTVFLPPTASGVVVAPWFTPQAPNVGQTPIFNPMVGRDKKSDGT